MDVGTYTATISDNMYVGLKSESGLQQDWGDEQSAVIAWGNNPIGSNAADRLRFIFASDMSQPSLASSSNDGLEIARMVTDGNIGKMGIGNFFTPNVDPINTLEIRSDVAANVLNPVNSTGPTRSGLRFTNLNATTGIDATSNSSNTVLSVNDDGDVILVDDSGTGIGTCTNPTILATDAGIQLDGNSFYFDGQTSSDKVAIGLPCSSTISSKLQIRNDVTDNQTVRAVIIENNGNNSNSANIAFGLISNCIGTGGIDNVGAYLRGGNNPLGSQNYGVIGQGFGGFDAIGGGFIATSASLNYGMVATVATPQGGSPLDVAGLFNGDIEHTGNINFISDVNLKENITSIPNSLELLSKIEPTTFNFRTTPYLALPQGKQYGFVAQELELVFPELVNTINIPELKDNTGTIVQTAQSYKGVNYLGLIPLSVRAINDLNLIVSKQTLSDAQLKQNVQPLQNSLSLLNQLNGIKYQWNQQMDTSLNLPAGTEVGLIAQNVETIIPEVVYTDNKGYKHVEYQKLVPYLIEANKQLQDSLSVLQTDNNNLQTQLNNLNQQVTAIQSCLDNLGCGTNSSMPIGNNDSPNNENQAIQEIDLASAEQAILYQNEPNPFNHSTTIRYYIPEETEKAMLVFYDEYGRELQREYLNNKGNAQVRITSEKLAAGVYTYSLVIDGKVHTTKKMVKVN